MQPRRYILKLSCPDRVGIIAAVSGFLAEHRGWIVEAHHHADPQTRTFFMRQEVLAESLAMDADALRQKFQPLADRFAMSHTISDTDVLKRVLILTSRQTHCLDDLLFRWRTGEMRFTLTAVVSNHEDSRDFVEWHKTPYHHVPIDRQDRDAGFHRIDELVRQYEPD